VAAAVALTQAQQLLVAPPSWAVAVVAQAVLRHHQVAHLLLVARVAQPQLHPALREQPEPLRVAAVARKVLTAVPLALVALGALKSGCGNGTNIRTCWA
jgi:hypothetical protein